jgi:hypothetical protein
VNIKTIDINMGMPTKSKKKMIAGNKNKMPSRFAFFLRALKYVSCLFILFLFSIIYGKELPEKLPGQSH